MVTNLSADFEVMKQSMKRYVEQGCLVHFGDIKDEPPLAIKPNESKLTNLKKMEIHDMRFSAVDCSTRTLKRANNWGIYVFRVSSASVRNRKVDWNFKETIRAVEGDMYVRRKILQEIRLQLESEMALELLPEIDEDDYILLDGASYFGGERKFSVMLYERCEKRGVKLLAMSKQSPTLRDQRGRDLIAAICLLAHGRRWMYYPVKTANIHEHLYGDVSIVKLCEDSPRAFRCDIMSYLDAHDKPSLLSPLSAISEDPRCIGYPIVLWLAHDFSAVSGIKLLHYHAKVEEELANAGLLDTLYQEELACNFADLLHGTRYAFASEWIGRV